MKKIKPNFSQAASDLQQVERIPAGNKARAKHETSDSQQRRSVETRDRIVLAAVHGFATLGYEGYSTRMVSVDSNTHPSLVTYHFDGKLGLWKATLLKLLRDFRDRLGARRLITPPIDEAANLRLIFEEFIRFNASCPEFASILLDGSAHPDDRFSWIKDTIADCPTGYWVTLIRAAQAAGRFVQGDAEMLLQAYLGAAMRVYLAVPEVERNMGQSPFTEEFIQRHMKTCLDLFFIDPKRDTPSPV